MMDKSFRSTSYFSGGNMETRHRPYYCYLSKGIPTIVEDEPDNFLELPGCYLTHCPNIQVAEMTYQANLKIMQWRTMGK